MLWEKTQGPHTGYKQRESEILEAEHWLPSCQTQPWGLWATFCSNSFWHGFKEWENVVISLVLLSKPIKFSFSRISKTWNCFKRCLSCSEEKFWAILYLKKKKKTEKKSWTWRRQGGKACMKHLYVTKAIVSFIILGLNVFRVNGPNLMVFSYSSKCVKLSIY